MKYILITFIIIFAFNPLFSQKDTSQFYNKTLSKNNFSIELAGKALFYSVGYERILFRTKKNLVIGSINLSYMPIFRVSQIIVPTGIKTLIGEKRNKLILGLYTTNSFDFNPNPSNRKEREAYRADGKYKYDKNYYPPYRLYFIVPSVGYRRYFKNGNSVSIEYNHLIYNFYGELFFTRNGIGPWLGINYNLIFLK